MLENTGELAAAGAAKDFDIFILSDTRDLAVAAASCMASSGCASASAARVNVYYRRRRRTVTARPATSPTGSTRWGGAYDHMMVLDADSLMTRRRYRRAGARDGGRPDAGIIQTVPLIVDRRDAVCPPAAVRRPHLRPGDRRAALRPGMGRDGNYWGHNAIMRTRAFADAARPARTSGPPPFGGHILSHDFVEAALMRRAGWAVHMLPALGGSYEESPPTLIDLAARDRRWCQGNLQHMQGGGRQAACTGSAGCI